MSSLNYMHIFKKSDVLLTQERIKEWLIVLRAYCYHPSTGYGVTTVLCAKTPGDDAYYYFAGVNVENIDNRLSTHSEEGAIAAMITVLGKSAEIIEGWVMCAPKGIKPGDDDPLANCNVICCGKCRQQIAELAQGNVIIHTVSLNGQFEQTTVDEFLPGSFSFRDLSANILKTKTFSESVSQSDLANKLIRNTEMELTEKEIFQWLSQLESIDYASKTGQAVVLKLEGNHYVAGVNIENAAYISISPIQCAIANAKASYKEVVVEQIWVVSQVREEPNLIVAKTCMPLTFSSLQVLLQFAKNDSIPIHMLNADGRKIQIQFNQSFQFLVKFLQ